MRGIYIHIPFCVRKCPYCSFVSYKVTEDVMNAFHKRLLKEIENAPGIEADTVYFGGGTPTYYGAERLCEILKCIESKFDIKADAEITVEANPGTVTGQDFKLLFDAGFNRVSIGIQSLQSEELESLGRIHSADEAKQAVMNAYDAGFKNISGDIMFGTEGQTIKSLENTLCEFMSLPLTHISAYSLSIEEGTPYFDNPPQLPDEDTEREMYRMIGFECLSYGTRALLWGLPLSLLIDFGIQRIGSNVSNEGYLFPWGTVAVAVVTVFLIVFVTMFYAVSKLRKDNPIDAIRMENT